MQFSNIDRHEVAAQIRELTGKLLTETAIYDETRAITEMIRVARPGTKIVIVDETEKIVKHIYEKRL